MLIYEVYRVLRYIDSFLKSKWKFNVDYKVGSLNSAKTWQRLPFRSGRRAHVVICAQNSHTSYTNPSSTGLTRSFCILVLSQDKMFSSIISVFLIIMFTTTILAIENNDNSRVIFGARCEARCFAKVSTSSQQQVTIQQIPKWSFHYINICDSISWLAI